MSSAVSELLNIITGEPKEEIKIAEGFVQEDDPLKIEISGTVISGYEINRDLLLSRGNRLLCLISDGKIYIICKLGGAGA